MRFLIPSHMFPGVYRQNVGFFKPGDVLVLPDAASQPGDVLSPRLLPLDEEARAELKRQHKIDRPLAQIGGPEPAPEPLTLKEAAVQAGVIDPDDKQQKPKRAADK
jgi:hypothetical protein